MVLLRRELGDVLREHRQTRGLTLRGLSALAAVSPGYLSEIERGTKEASSELLASVCAALGVPLIREPSYVEWLKERFRRFNRPMPSVNVRHGPAAH